MREWAILGAIWLTLCGAAAAAPADDDAIVRRAKLHEASGALEGAVALRREALVVANTRHADEITIAKSELALSHDLLFTDTTNRPTKAEALSLAFAADQRIGRALSRGDPKRPALLQQAADAVIVAADYDLLSPVSGINDALADDPPLRMPTMAEARQLKDIAGKVSAASYDRAGDAAAAALPIYRQVFGPDNIATAAAMAEAAQYNQQSSPERIAMGRRALVLLVAKNRRDLGFSAAVTLLESDVDRGQVETAEADLRAFAENGQTPDQAAHNYAHMLHAFHQVSVGNPVEEETRSRLEAALARTTKTAGLTSPPAVPADEEPTLAVDEPLRMPPPPPGISDASRNAIERLRGRENVSVVGKPAEREAIRAEAVAALPILRAELGPADRHTLSAWAVYGRSFGDLSRPGSTSLAILSSDYAPLGAVPSLAMAERLYLLTLKSDAQVRDRAALERVESVLAERAALDATALGETHPETIGVRLRLAAVREALGRPGQPGYAHTAMDAMVTLAGRTQTVDVRPVITWLEACDVVAGHELAVQEAERFAASLADDDLREVTWRRLMQVMAVNYMDASHPPVAAAGLRFLRKTGRLLAATDLEMERQVAAAPAPAVASPPAALATPMPTRLADLEAQAAADEAHGALTEAVPLRRAALILRRNQSPLAVATEIALARLVRDEVAQGVANSEDRRDFDALISRPPSGAPDRIAFLDMIVELWKDSAGIDVFDRALFAELKAGRGDADIETALAGEALLHQVFDLTEINRLVAEIAPALANPRPVTPAVRDRLAAIAKGAPGTYGGARDAARIGLWRAERQLSGATSPAVLAMAGDFAALTLDGGKSRLFTFPPGLTREALFDQAFADIQASGKANEPQFAALREHASELALRSFPDRLRTLAHDRQPDLRAPTAAEVAQLAEAERKIGSADVTAPGMLEVYEGERRLIAATFGPRHPLYARLAPAYATALIALDKPVQAQTALEQGRLAMAAALGADTKETLDYVDDELRTIQNIHYRPLDGQRLTWLDGLLATMILRDRQAHDAPELIYHQAMLAADRDLEGRADEAEALMLEALGTSDRTNGVRSDRSLGLAGRLANFYQRQQQFTKAEPMIQRGYDAAAYLGGTSTEVIVPWLIQLADNQRFAGGEEDARVLYEKALRLRTAQLGAEEPATQLVADRLALQARHLPPPPTAAMRTKVTDNSDPGRFDGGQKVATQVPEDRPVPDAVLAPARKLSKSFDDAVAARRWADALATGDQLQRVLDELTASGQDVREPRAILLTNRAIVLQRMARFGEAETTERRLLALQESRAGAVSIPAASALLALGLCLDQEGRLQEAQAMFERAISIARLAGAPAGDEEPAIGSDPASLALANNLEEQGRAADAEPLRRATYKTGDDDFDARASLAANLKAQGKLADAQALYPKDAGDSYLVTDQWRGHLDSAFKVVDIELLKGDVGPALRLATALRQGAIESDGAGSPVEARATLLLGRAQLASNNPNLAVQLLGPACETLERKGLAAAAGEVAERLARKESGACATLLGTALWQARAQQPSGLPRAFEAAQRAEMSDAGVALSRAGARTAAQASGAGSTVAEYEAALVERRLVDADLAAAVADRSSAAAQPKALESRRNALDARLSGLIATLRQRFPSYWDLRNPEPLAMGMLQGTAASAGLLRTDEALVSFLLPENDSPGLVFAVSRTTSAWAAIGMSGNEIRRTVATLRQQIAARAIGDSSMTGVPAFDRALSHRLYLALFGDPAVRPIVERAGTLLLVPSGPLTDLPPAVLVTQPPTGRDDDPTAQRATAWLLRAHAIAVLPSVASLATARSASLPPPGDRAPLTAFVAPDFSGTGASPPPADSAAARGPAPEAHAFYRDGVAIRSALAGLPQLPATRIEGSQLAGLLHAAPTSVISGRDASEARLRALNASGDLSRVRVLEFATHGLVAGDMDVLAEPALALAAPADPAAGPENDGLLTASEATALHLNADWVLLSACNTASPDAHATGLSGLSRAFLFAGARAVLASHWRVGDGMAELIVTGLFRGPKSENKAQALRRSALAVLDNSAIAGTDPWAWAPFVLIGSPD